MAKESYVVTDDMEWISFKEMDRFSVKESKALNPDKDTNYENIVEPQYQPNDMLRLLDINPYHKRCCEVIANDISGVGFTLQPTIEEASETNRELLLELFDNVNLNEIIVQTEFDAQAIGYGLIEVVRENGRDSPVKDLRHFPPTSFRRHDDGVRVQQRVGQELRWFVIMGANVDEQGRIYDVNCFTGEISYNKLPEHLRANELLWINRYSPSSQYYGVSPIISALSSLYGDYYRAEYNSKFFKNYGMPAFAVTITGDFDPETDIEPGEATLREKIQQSLRSVIKNPHSALIIEVPSEGAEGNVSVDIQPLSTDNKEASFTIYRKNNRDEIISAHGVDQNRLSIAEAGQLNGSNSEQLNSAYKSSVIVPYRRQLQDLITLRIIREAYGITDWRLEFIDSDTDNTKDDVDNILRLVQFGVMTINEAREYLGETFNIQTKDDLILDEHYYNGRPLTASGFDNLGFDSIFVEEDNEINNTTEETDNP